MSGSHGERLAPKLGAGTAWRIGSGQTYKLLSGYNRVHLVTEHPYAAELSDKFKSGGDKADLFHRYNTRHRTQRLAGLCR